MDPAGADTARRRMDRDAPFAFDAAPASALDAPTSARLRALFHASYRAPSDAYLEQSLRKLRFVATARADEDLAGFAIGDLRVIDLPRLPRQPVALAGLCCVDPRFRRRGLFRELEQRAFRAAAGAVAPSPRLLSCGRVAHPASFRTIRWSSTHVPKRGVPPTPWQREVGAAIADAYGAEGFDPETFVCVGGGSPMHPIIDVDVPAEEWELFAPADRERGDTILGLLWTPDAPEGW